MKTNTDPAGAAWYVPKSQADKPEEEQARYKIRGLIGTEAMDVHFHVDEDARMSMTARGGNACLRAGLLGWEHRLAGDGTPIEFSDKDWKANIAGLHPLDAVEIALEIWNRTFLDEAQKKT